jgi:hypothetical protein
MESNDVCLLLKENETKNMVYAFNDQLNGEIELVSTTCSINNAQSGGGISKFQIKCAIYIIIAILAPLKMFGGAAILSGINLIIRGSCWPAVANLVGNLWDQNPVCYSFMAIMQTILDAVQHDPTALFILGSLVAAGKAVDKYLIDRLVDVIFNLLNKQKQKTINRESKAKKYIDVVKSTVKKNNIHKWGKGHQLGKGRGKTRRR